MPTKEKAQPQQVQTLVLPKNFEICQEPKWKVELE